MLPPQKQKPAAEADAVYRLGRQLESLVGPGWQQLDYGVAVSGGPDSMALLWLMVSLLPGQVRGATVDHGLRQGAADEARMVAGFCARDHIPHDILTPPVPIRGSFQAAARAERYRLLDAWRDEHAIDHIVTAHHADDQLETMIMRLNRSSGVGGLAAIRVRNGAILRPLLGWRRADLVALALDADLPFVDDPSNADVRFDRARLRQDLRSQNFLDAEAAARSAQWLADADVALDWTVDQLIARWPDAADRAAIRDQDYPAEIFRRIVTLRLCAYDPRLTLRGVTLDGVIAAMREGRRAMVGGLLIDRVKGSDGDFWRISAAPRRKARDAR